MPRAASKIVVPGATSIGRPSIVRCTRSDAVGSFHSLDHATNAITRSHRAHARRARSPEDVRLDLVVKCAMTD